MSNHIKASELNHSNSQKKTVITADGQLAQVYQFHNSLCLGIPYLKRNKRKKISVEEKGKHLQGFSRQHADYKATFFIPQT